MEQIYNDVYINSNGQLRDSFDYFHENTGQGLLKLLCLEDCVTGQGRIYIKKLFIDIVLGLLDFAEPETSDPATVEKALSDAWSGKKSIQNPVDSMPPIKGAEFADEAFFENLFNDFSKEFVSAFVASGKSLIEYIRGLSSQLLQLGKVTFHLAENKGEKAVAFPFAFLATFEYLNSDGLARHFPLKKALISYSNNTEILQRIIEPIIKASESSKFIKRFLENQRIYNPAALTVPEAVEFIRDIEVFRNANITVKITKLWKKTPPQAKVNVKIGNEIGSFLDSSSMLQFSASVALDGEELTGDELKEVLGSEDGLVRLRGQWVVVDSKKIAELLGYWNSAKRNGLTLIEALRLNAGLDLNGKAIGESSSENYSIEAVGNFKEALETFRGSRSISDKELPSGSDKILRGYQKTGIQYLKQVTDFGLGACLADDMGLGKTLQLLTLAKIWKKAGLFADLPALIVLPLTLMENWCLECSKFASELNVVKLHRAYLGNEDFKKLADKPYEILHGYDLALITYSSLPRFEKLTEIEFPAVIADEAQAIKTPDSRQSKAVRALRGIRRIALTGTPVENHLSDLWSIFDFINRGLLGSLNSFKNFIKGLDGDYSSLRKVTKPFILRRLKTDKAIISDLPDKTELDVYCNLSKSQAALYERSVNEMARILADSKEDNFERNGLVLKYLTVFKQICNHCAQYLGDGDYREENSGKFQRLAEIVETVAEKQEKMLVFTQYREMTEPLRNFLRDHFGRDGLVLHGGISAKERAKLVTQFQDPDGPQFFVLSIKAGGTGLNLTAANHVVLFDRWWNPAVESQACDRAFRIGQKKNVLVHKFICKGTLEERINELLCAKKALADDILNSGAEKLLTQMNNKELLDFIKLDVKGAE